MLKVILVDDEHNVRQGVKMMIPWDELGLEVIGEGEDGDDGLAKILSLKPDIVIADVKMPGMTGIQMIEAAKKGGYEGKCLILSGYSDFTYAKEAMSLGVKGFILKPVDEDELIEALKELCEEIKEEHKDEVTMQKGSEYLNTQLVRALLLGDEKIINSSNLDAYNYDCYDAAIISTSEDMELDERTLMLTAVKARLEIFGNIDIITPDLSGITAVLFKGWKRNEVIDFLTKLNKDYFGKIFVTVGDTVTSPYDINQSYQEASALFKNRFMYLHCGVVTNDTLDNESKAENEIDEIINQIYAYVEINDLDKLESTLEVLRQTLCNNSLTAERIKVICITGAMTLKARVAKNIGDKKTEQFLNDEFIAHLGEKSSLFDIIEYLKSTLTALSNTHFGRTTKSTMERVVQYICSNYNHELRLEQLATIFGYNSAYLGKVFHQYTGENFNNYLDRIRITEAKRLLGLDEYKVYEVAEMVGYTNINYFHNKFKKYVGMSPLNFKRQCKNEPLSDDEEE
ncbi:MAG: response regulator transcription factor [Oscillospiraceae bacterium]|nr:response regulator transcription factor [Oscillospiraceae bacterium]